MTQRARDSTTHTQSKMKNSLVLLFAGAALRQSLRGIRKSVFYATRRASARKAAPQLRRK